MDDPRARPLRRSDLDPDPLRQFQAWYREAVAASVVFADAMALATSSTDGAPSVRMVLLKGADAEGFVFHTGYRSRKGRELAENPRAALLFYWHPLGRQVRVEGRAERLPRSESEAYFRTRPREARLAAIASHQSEPITSRDELEARFAALAAKLGGADPALPDHWGGFRVVPELYEFWQHRENRLHDRFLYTRAGERWAIERLQP